ncbi:hypothetical protein E1264_15025 [Actinomadura sp. KC216]|nr:hypothetical protein E1264_15025 [Actinomadura sp. KC216]
MMANGSRGPHANFRGPRGRAYPVIGGTRPVAGAYRRVLRGARTGRARRTKESPSWLVHPPVIVVAWPPGWWRSPPPRAWPGAGATGTAPRPRADRPRRRHRPRRPRPPRPPRRPRRRGRRTGRTCGPARTGPVR